MGLFRMPSLGADMEAGKLAEWLKQPGDRVKSGDIIAVVETQKGAIEIEVFETGMVESHLLPVGATVPVGTELAMIRTDGAAGAEPISTKTEPPAPIQPVARAVAIAAPPAIAAISPEKKVSPAARHFAKEHGIDWSSLQGSGPEGSIVYIDVENAWLTRRTPAGPAKALPSQKKAAAGTDAMRTAIAAAMARSKRDIPHYYLGHTVDVTKGIDWMTGRNETRPLEQRLLLPALLLKAVALALEKFPEFNGHFRDGRFAPAAHVHAGMAIALRGGGLVAPAIHDTAVLSLDQVMSALRDLTNRVRAGRFRGSELSDPTITLTSLGDRGVDWVQPVIYPPQVAIVGAGAPQLRPWIVDGQVLPRQVCELTLAADHRVSDGHRGALLLQAIADRLQSPEAL
jgi:pyruvate dehydrogenase E2 component (dihydrolipoamide acetyltransferase)